VEVYFDLNRVHVFPQIRVFVFTYKECPDLPILKFTLNFTEFLF